VGNVVSLTTLINSEFNRITTRMISRARKSGSKIPRIHMSHNVVGNNVHFTFAGGDQSSVLSIPVPYKSTTGANVINSSDCVVRILNTYMVNTSNVEGQDNFVEMDYIEYIIWKIGNTTLIERISRETMQGGLALAVGQVQRHIDSEIINALPLSETPVNDWAMNMRVVFVDPIFSQLTPDQILQYQVEKNKKWFPWTSMGLSDGVLVKNYILKEDLKKYTPFGEKLHNPQRNLYQTLGMKGDNTPILETSSADKLSASGITRHGWTLMTAFLDTPDTFEDQIIVDNRLKDLSVTEHRRFTSFGGVLVNTGDLLIYGAILSIEPSGEEQLFEVHNDGAVVESIKPSVANIGGSVHNINIITVAITRKFKEGTKITNRHGNKGVIRFADLGYVVDPIRGKVPLDIVSAGTSVKRRKNFGQILEALTTLVLGIDNKIVVDDAYAPSTEEVSAGLVKHGYSTDGTCKVETSFGNFNAVCGWVFWGVSKTPEDQVWTAKETTRTDATGLRQAGNKLSSIEIRSMVTAFGIGNGMVNEVLSYSQGQELVLEELAVLQSLKGKHDPSLPTATFEEVNVCEDGRVFHPEEVIVGTIHEETFMPIGGYISLPFTYYTAVGTRSNTTVYEGAALPPEGFAQSFKTDKIYIPSSLLRRPWKHKSGMLGLTLIGSVLNRMIIDCKTYARTKSTDDKEIAVRSIHRYHSTVASNLSGKNGHISTYGMSVRYPNSTKGVAVQKSSLPKDTVEIYKTMAHTLGVSHGDLVLCERFPCLGFPSLVIRRVLITDDISCKYAIRVSNNSNVCQGLDFDGDVLYLMSFFTKEAKQALHDNFSNPHPMVKKTIEELNNAKTPAMAELTLQDYELAPFEPLIAATQADIVRRATGVKAHTGPIIALCYNLMRINEIGVDYADREFHLSMEAFMEKVGQSVFDQKHGTESLQALCTEAICTANENKLVSLGFERAQAAKMCSMIKRYARELGITNLVWHHQKATTSGGSKIVNLIVRHYCKTYFASRSTLHGLYILDHINVAPKDVPSHMFKRIIQPEKLSENKFDGIVKQLQCSISSRAL
jgi:hypothetical protein